jgi:hypothetical protein
VLLPILAGFAGYLLPLPLRARALRGAALENCAKKAL